MPSQDDNYMAQVTASYAEGLAAIEEVKMLKGFLAFLAATQTEEGRLEIPVTHYICYPNQTVNIWSDGDVIYLEPERIPSE